MREFFLNIFSYKGEAGSIFIDLFSIWHFLYLILIFGGGILTAFLIRKKSDKFKSTFVKVLAYIIPGLYIFDLFILALLGNMGAFVDKLPFHICNIMSFFVPFVQFNKKFEPIREVVTCLALVSSLMYMTYPGSALGGIAPWSYKVVQTFAYHGVLFVWGLLSITTKQVNLNFKNIWKVLVALTIMVAWAFFGNYLYSSPEHHYDWFFVTGSTFPFIPTWLMPFAVVVAVFGVAACIYLIDFVAKKIIAKKQSKSTLNDAEKEEVKS